MYKMIGFADIMWEEYLLLRLLPTVLANLIFLIAFYPIFKKWFINWSSELSS